ncbi:hypothetical protein BD414DRAFT_471505 [Trametes punicea]|nr:hypothetical protein BD414DRAFT_471505 [Trametes punicea]
MLGMRRLRHCSSTAGARDEGDGGCGAGLVDMGWRSISTSPSVGVISFESAWGDTGAGSGEW